MLKIKIIFSWKNLEELFYNFNEIIFQMELSFHIKQYNSSYKMLWPNGQCIVNNFNEIIPVQGEPDDFCNDVSFTNQSLLLKKTNMNLISLTLNPDQTAG